MLSVIIRVRHVACWCAGFVSLFLIALLHCHLLCATRRSSRWSQYFIAQGKYGKVHIRVPTQVTSMDAAVTAWVVGVAEGGVSLTVTLLGGGFGRCPQLDDIA